MPRVSPLGFRNLSIVFRVSLSKPYNFLILINKRKGTKRCKRKVMLSEIKSNKHLQ